MDLFCKQSILQGDCLEVMRGMEANSIDCILTDPPYGLSFMGKHWDKGVPDQTFWAEALRVCKPGATMLAFGGTRTYHRLACEIEDAGWEIRDCMCWLYGSGFPKSYNFGKQLGGDWNGYGTALKPAYEPILLAMKPLDGTFAQNAEKWGVAGINIDECRIGLAENKRAAGTRIWEGELQNAPHDGKGRWPSNLLLDEEAAAMLDEQSGFSSSKSGGFSGSNANPMSWKEENKNRSRICPNDSGGASRFFYCAKASPAERNKGCEGLELKQVQSGCGGNFPIDDEGENRDRFKKKSQNIHPTVKPTKLLEYLLKLIMPPRQDAIILDPFCGSGSTLVAAKNLGFNAVGIEIEEEYCNIARHRIE